MSATSSLLISIVDTWILTSSAMANGTCSWNSGTNTFSINQTSSSGSTWENILNEFLNFKSAFYIQQPANSAILVLSVNGTIPAPSGGVVAIPVTVVQATGALNTGTNCEIGIGPASSVNELSNTAITAPANGEVLTYNSSTQKWYNGSGGGAGGGTVTAVTAGTGLTATPNPIVGAGTIDIANTAVTAGSYTNANITVNAQGQLTAAANGSGGSGSGIVANYGAFAAGQQATYDSGLSQWSNPPKCALQFYYQYDSSQTTTPAAGKFSIQSTTPPATVYFNDTSLDGVSAGTVLQDLSAKNYLTAVTTPYGNLAFTGNGVSASGCTSFECLDALVSDYTNNAYVTFTFLPSNALYVDASNNVSSSDKVVFSGSAANNTIYAANPLVTAIHTGSSNTLIGQNAFAPTGTLSASNVTAVGASALSNATVVTGGNIVAVGSSAGALSTGAAAQLVMIGENANFSGASTDSVCIGYTSGSQGAAVTQCCAVGVNASCGANQNTVMGYAATANADVDNVIVGTSAVSAYARSICVGAETKANANGSVSIGYQAMGSMTHASDPNVAVGQEAGETVSGGKNTLIGTSAGHVCGASGQNTFVGHQSGGGMTDTTPPSNCTAVGTGAMGSYSASSQSTAFGVDVLIACSGAGNNCGIGTGVMSLGSGMTGQNNVCVGENCAPVISTGSNNTIAGQNACGAMTTGTDNCVIGQNAFDSELTGSSCVVIGAQAVSGNNSGITNSVFIGAQTCPLLSQSTTPTNMIVIGQSNMTSVTDCGSNIICLGSQSMGSVPPSSTSAEFCICVGNSSLTNNGSTNTVCLGTQSLGAGDHSETVAIGNQLLNTASSSSAHSVLIGHGVQTTTGSASNSNVIIAHSGAPDLACAGCVFIGSDCCQDGGSSGFTGITDNVLVGSGADIGATGVSGSVGIGAGVNVANTNAICLGSSCGSTADNSLNLNRVTTGASFTNGATDPLLIPALFLQVFINSVEYRLPLFTP